MSRISDHPLWAHLNTVCEAVKSIPKELGQRARDEDEYDVEILDRLRVVVEQVQAITGGTDPHLVTSSMLSELDAQLVQLQGHLSSLVTEEDLDYLDPIDTALDGTLDVLTGWGSSPALRAPEIRKLAAAVGEAARERLAELERRAGEIRAALEEISTASEAAVQRIQEAADEQHSTISTEQARVTSEIATQTTRITQALGQQETDFEAAEAKRKEEFDELVTDLQARATNRADEQTTANAAALEALEEQISELRQRTEEETNAILDRLQVREKEAAALVDLVATSSTAGAYGKEAVEQKTAADDWRGWVLKIGGLAALVATASVVFTILEGFELQAFLPKLVLTLVIAGLAGYAGKQSADHRRREQRAKRLELELLAFGPFTEKLTAEQAQAARIAFIERAFVGDQGTEQKGGTASAEQPAAGGPGAGSLIADLLRSIIPGGDKQPPAA